MMNIQERMAVLSLESKRESREVFERKFSQKTDHVDRLLPDM